MNKSLLELSINLKQKSIWLNISLLKSKQCQCSVDSHNRLSMMITETSSLLSGPLSKASSTLTPTGPSTKFSHKSLLELTITSTSPATTALKSPFSSSNHSPTPKLHPVLKELNKATPQPSTPTDHQWSVTYPYLQYPFIYYLLYLNSLALKFYISMFYCL